MFMYLQVDNWLALQHFNLPQLRYDLFWLVSLSSHLLVLQVEG